MFSNDTYDIIGIARVKLRKFMAGGCVILKFVFKNHAHVVKTLLDYVVGRGYILRSGWNLLQIILHAMRVVLFLYPLFIFGRNRVVGGFKPLLALFALLLVVIKRETGLVAPAPVILEFAGAPAALELGLAGILCHGVVEIPRLVGVHSQGGV